MSSSTKETLTSTGSARPLRRAARRIPFDQFFKGSGILLGQFVIEEDFHFALLPSISSLVIFSGYSTRVWNMPMMTFTKALAILSMSWNVRSLSSSCPEFKRSLIILRTNPSIFPG